LPRLIAFLGHSVPLRFGVSGFSLGRCRASPSPRTGSSWVYRSSTLFGSRRSFLDRPDPRPPISGWADAAHPEAVESGRLRLVVVTVDRRLAPDKHEVRPVIACGPDSCGGNRRGRAPREAQYGVRPYNLLVPSPSSGLTNKLGAYLPQALSRVNNSQSGGSMSRGLAENHGQTRLRQFKRSQLLMVE